MPETATTAMAHSASTEYRAIASGSRLLPRNATQPSATRPPTQTLTPTTWRNRLVVARSCDPEDVAVAGERDGQQGGQRHPEPDRQGPDADRPPAGHGNDRRDGRLHEERPAERGVERQ